MKSIPKWFSQDDLLERDFLPIGHSEYTLSIEIKRITIQPSKYKPVNCGPVELETTRLKRALVSMHIVEDSKQAEAEAIVEFRGKGLTLSLTKGDCDVGQVAWRLSRFYYMRYDRVGVKIHSPSGARRLCDCTLEKPDLFVNMLHLIGNNGGLTIHVWEEKSSEPFGHNKMESYQLGSKPPQILD